MSIPPNTLMVGHTLDGEVCIDHPDLKPDEHGIGHIIFSIEQARAFARTVWDRANTAEAQIRLPDVRRSVEQGDPFRYDTEIWKLVGKGSGATQQEAESNAQASIGKLEAS